MVYKRLFKFFLFITILLNASCVGVSSARSVHLQEKLIKDPLTKDETIDLLAESGKNWVFGEGIGESGLKIATTIALPVAGILWISNDLASLFGYKGLSFSDILPEKSAAATLESYQGIISIPGHITSLATSEGFRNRQVAQRKVEDILYRHENPIDLLDF